MSVEQEEGSSVHAQAAQGSGGPCRSPEELGSVGATADFRSGLVMCGEPRLLPRLVWMALCGSRPPLRGAVPGAWAQVAPLPPAPS